MKICKADAIRALEPNSSFVVFDDVRIEWNSPDITQPTETQINDKIKELEKLEPTKLVRIKRNQLLAESDWTQTRDNVRLNDNTWVIYRQELRDITKSASFNPKLNADGSLDESSVTWPLKPAT